MSDSDAGLAAGGPAAAAQAAAATAPSRTLALVKPDASHRAEEILHLAELAGFVVIRKQRLQLTPARAEAFYESLRERPFFAGLVEFMASGPIVAAVLARRDAVRAWRDLIGPTNALEARVKAPKSLRALFGSDGTRNAVHGSDSSASAAREVAFFFPDLPADAGTVLRGNEARAYIATALQPTLVKALTALAKAKPSSDQAEALDFLANWLLENNPNAPRLVVPKAACAEASTAAGAAAASTAAEPQSAGGAQQLGSSAPTPDGANEAAVKAREQARQDAATKVQAAIRGHQARLHVADMRASAQTVAAV